MGGFLWTSKRRRNVARSRMGVLGSAGACALILATFVAAEPALAATITEYPVPTQTGNNLWGITTGTDGNLWFAEEYANKIARITTSGSIHEYPTPGTSSSGPYGITSGPDGALWFTARFGSEIVRMTTGGAFTEYPIPGGGSPAFIVTGPDNALWYTDDGGNFIGRVTTSGSFSKYPLPVNPSFPYGIAAGSDGALWFTERNTGRIGRITVLGTITEYVVPLAGSNPNFIAAGSDLALWFTDDHSKAIWRLTTTGSFTEYTYPGAGAPEGITAGPDGALWFADGASNFIGRITTSGSVTEYSVPTSSSLPNQITSGPDSALWFTELNGNNIGRLAVVGAPASLSLAPKTQLLMVGSQACLTATVSDSNGARTPNVNVVFNVTTAAVTQASPSSGTVVTNSSGQATFCYTAQLSGQDAVHAFADTNKNGVQDPGEPSDDATVTWFAFGTSSGATFAIGDLAPNGTGPALPGDAVTWWSSQWASLNPMTGGPSPSSMKGFPGFGDMPAIPNCGGTYRTSPGNSGSPPATVPNYMGVIVSSHVTRNGSVITGDVRHIVVVKTNPGYVPDPGHSGTGTVVSYLC